MFRDIVYITTDYSLRIQDGWLIFRWWRSYVPKDVSEGIKKKTIPQAILSHDLHILIKLCFIQIYRIPTRAYP